jgi:PAS domain S-box-containing protein
VARWPTLSKGRRPRSGRYALGLGTNAFIDPWWGGVGVDRYYKHLFDNAPIGIVNVDLTGKPVMLNRRAAATFGYDSPEHFLQEVASMLDLWADPKQRDRAVELMREAGRLEDFPVVMKRRDGSWLTLLVSASPVLGEHGVPIGVQVAGIDISDRVASERKLEEAQVQAAIGFWSWRLDTDTFSGTREVFDIAGLEDIGDGPMSRFLELLHPADRCVVDRTLTTFERAADELFEMEFRIITPAGETKWVIVRCRVEGDGIQVYGSLQDITAQKLVEERLKALNEMKSEFVGVVAHDLRTPLTVASGYAEFLDERWDEITPDEQRNLVGRLRDPLRRLATLVSDVLEVTKIESGVLSLDIVPLDIGGLVEDVVSEIRSIGRHPNVKASIADVLPEALGDRESIWRVLTNLVSNAVKYTPDGELIDIGVEHRGRFLEVSVRDRGPGIDRIDQPKLFQKFSRLPTKGDEPRPPGTGLGLFICKSLVESLGGAIWVESERGAGSTFRFTVPVNDATGGVFGAPSAVATGGR